MTITVLTERAVTIVNTKKKKTMTVAMGIDKNYNASSYLDSGSTESYHSL
jgi:hypothetical protein